MKIKLILLLLSSSLVFSASIGSNFLGVNISHTKFEQTSGNFEVDGVGFGLIGNYNLYGAESYGIDVNAEFSFANNLSGTPTTVEVEIARLDYVFRPYYQLPLIKIFADIGYSSIKSERTNPNSKLLDSNRFLPAIGFEGSIGPIGKSELYFAPTLDFVNYGYKAKGLMYSIPLSYPINEKFGINANCTQSSLDSYKIGSTEIKNKFSVWSIGFDLKF